jgi:hypothetical protein
VDTGPNQDKSGAAVSEIEMIPLSTPQPHTQTLNFGQPRRAWTLPTASQSHTQTLKCPFYILVNTYYRLTDILDLRCKAIDSSYPVSFVYFLMRIACSYILLYSIITQHEFITFIFCSCVSYVEIDNLSYVGRKPTCFPKSRFHLKTHFC